MSVVHPSVSHPALAQEYYARPTTSTATVPPPLGSSSTLAMPPSPPPSFPHRHTSPFPESIQSFSALGPPEALTNPPPPTPKVVNAPLPDVPTVATDRHVPAVFPPTPDLSTPSNKVLFPDAMIKLAPPADDGQLDIYKGREKEEKVKETVEVARVPLNSLDHLVGDQVPTRSRSKSQQLLGGASVVDPVESRGKSVSPRPKPPKRSHTAVPSHSYRSSAPQGLDVRVRMHSHVSGLPRSKLSSLNPDSGSMHRTYPSEQSSRHLAVPSDHGVSDFGPSDDVQAKVVLLGAPDTGKTTFILRYTRKRFITDPNVTLNSTLHTGKSTHKGIKVKLQIWDTAGQEKFHGLSPLYFRGAHVCILLYDISSRSSFMELKKVLADLKEKVPDTVMIYVVGHKSDQEATRAVYPAEARAAIRLWTRPPVPVVNETLTPPSKKMGMFRSLSSASKHLEEAPKTITTARSHSFDGLSSMEPADKLTRPIVPPPTISIAAPVPSRYDSPRTAGAVPFPRSRPTSMSSNRAPPSSILRSPTSPTMTTFPPYVSPSSPTSATTPTHASFQSFPPYQKGNSSSFPAFTSEFGQPDYQTPLSSAKAAIGRHGASAGRFSISGFLGWGQASTESTGAVSSLARLAEENPPDHRRSDSLVGHSISPSRTTFGSSIMGSSRFDTRRKSEQWTSRIGWGGIEPSPADLLGEFGEGVKKKQSGEMSTGALSNLPARVTRSRGGSLGRDSRLHDDNHEQLDWGVDIDGIRLGECSSLTGEGVEETFRSINSRLVDHKDRLQMEQTLRKKNSIVLTAPAEPEDVQAQGSCCAI